MRTVDCEVCGGSGKVEVTDHAKSIRFNEPWTREVPCEECGGDGHYEVEEEEITMEDLDAC